MSDTHTPDAIKGNGSQPVPAAPAGGEASGQTAEPSYYKTLIEHWAEAFVDGPMKTIERHDAAAKLLVMLITPLQLALFKIYDSVGEKVSPTPSRLTTLSLLGLFLVSIAWVVYCVAKVCDERPHLKLKLPESPAGCAKPTGVISFLLAGAISGRIPARQMIDAVNAWEEEIEHVANCKHMWLTRAVTVSVLISVAALGVLIAAASIG